MKRKKNTVVLILLLAFQSFSAFSQDEEPLFQPVDSVFSLKLTPGLGIPLGDDADIFTLGGGGDVLAQFQIPLLPTFDLDLHSEIGYNLTPIKANNFISIIAFALGLGVSWEFVPRLILGGYARGGYSYAFLNDTSSLSSSQSIGLSHLFAGGGLSFTFMLFPAIGVGLESSYRYYFGLKNNLAITLAASYHFPSAPSGDMIEIENIEFVPIFPVFFKYYDDNPVAKATIYNKGNLPLKDVKASLFIKRYMDDPKQYLVAESLEPGARKPIELFGLFADRILEISEGTKVTASITLEYDIAGQSRRVEFVESLRINNRNAMTWDDDRKAAAFVTAKDPAILKFSKNVVGMVKDMGGREVNANLIKAMGLHETLTLYGMSYVIDPTTPYVELSENKFTIDFLQFPRQTLDYKAGDCDDLSILYCALLESLGIETAFVTVPGHIYAAFSLGIEPDEARKMFLYPDDFIIRDDKVWLPVEVTQIGDGFLKAWQTGAKEWREFDPKGQTGFFPIHDAWQTYEPVGFLADVSEISLPPENVIVEAHVKELTRFVEREIGPRIRKLQADIERTQGNVRVRNKMGVLYARYGLDDKAEQEFNKILEQKEYLPALINIGNLYYLKDDAEKALEYYERAAIIAPNKPKVLLFVARANHALENYDETKHSYTKLKELDPELASRFAYLDLKGEEADRAAEIGQIKSVVIWEEE